MQFQNAKLETKLSERFKPPVTAEGIYTIDGVREGPLRARYPSIVMELTSNNAGTKHRMLVALPNDMDEISPYTNFGRLIEAFGFDSEGWLGKRIEIRIDQSRKKHIYPAISEQAPAPISEPT